MDARAKNTALGSGPAGKGKREGGVGVGGGVDEKGRK